MHEAAPLLARIRLPSGRLPCRLPCAACRVQSEGCGRRGVMGGMAGAGGLITAPPTGKAILTHDKMGVCLLPTLQRAHACLDPRAPAAFAPASGVAYCMV